MIENLKEIISLIVAIITLSSFLITFIAKNSKNIKVRRFAENLNVITKEVNKYVILAEDFINYTGKDKKEWVITKVNQFAIENGINFDVEVVGDLIEQAVALSKRVNQRDKDKEVL